MEYRKHILTIEPSNSFVIKRYGLNEKGEKEFIYVEDSAINKEEALNKTKKMILRDGLYAHQTDYEDENGNIIDLRPEPKKDL